MKNTVDAKNNLENKAVSLIYEDETTCPICKAKILPVFLNASYNTESTASVFNYCRSCKETFVTQYEVFKNGKTTSNRLYVEAKKVVYSAPNRFERVTFEDCLERLSPQFVKIYNQAEAAEVMQLDEIAGLGFRKALEFLVKDYSIHFHKNEEENIKKMNMASCIKLYVEDKRINTLAEKSAWIGNDEAHYVRKHEDLDVQDMKRFTQAMVYFVSMNLITEEAESISAK